MRRPPRDMADQFDALQAGQYLISVARPIFDIERAV